MKKIILLLTGLAGLLLPVLAKLANTPVKHQNLMPESRYSINPDLRFEAINKQFYATISRELNLLIRQFGKSKLIALSNNQKAQTLAPQTYSLLRSKISTIASRMGIDASKITIALQPIDYATMGDSDDVFNAYGQTIKQPIKKIITQKNDGIIVDTKIEHQTAYRHNLIITPALLKLIVWHEGDDQSSNKEGILDGVLAHELGHIFHRHMESTIACELQADKAGAKGLLNPINLIDATDVVLFAGNLYALLEAYNPKLNLNNENMLTIVTAVVSALIRNNKGFGYYSECSHAQYASQSSQAVCQAVTRILGKEATGNINTIISLLYDELKDSCLKRLHTIKAPVTKPHQKVSQAVALNSPSSHPDPKSRRQHFMQSLKHMA